MADLDKIRTAKIFKKLPERAFSKVIEKSQIRGFSKNETTIANLTDGEFKNSFGYIISGRVIFLDEENLPLGYALKDEFYLVRPFLLEGEEVKKVLSADDSTIILYIPKDVMEQLAEASTLISKRLSSVYEVVTERSGLIVKTIKSFPALLKNLKTLNLEDDSVDNWIGAIEKKLAKNQPKEEISRAN
jgi:signal-transduction protein with cAMP-binding, CBS, and nucleotidyltransferase domain